MNNLSMYTFETQNGLLLSTQTVPNGNMIYSTAQFFFISTSYIAPPYIKGLIDCENTHEGAFSRAPQLLVNTSVDDYLAVTCLHGFAVETLNRARKNFGFLDVNDNTYSFPQFMYRFQGFWNHMKISAHERVWPIGRFMWALSIFLAARQPFANQDSWIQSHLMVLVKERNNWKSLIGSLAVWYWRKRKGAVTTSEIMAKYLGADCQDHPLITAWKPYA